MERNDIAVWLTRRAKLNRLSAERVRVVAARAVRWCRVSGYNKPALHHAASLAASELQIIVERFAEERGGADRKTARSLQPRTIYR
jgi:hypothetical protein